MREQIDGRLMTIDELGVSAYDQITVMIRPATDSLVGGMRSRVDDDDESDGF